MAADLTIPAALAIDAFALDARHAFNLAAESGYRAVAFATNHPELAPDQLSASGRRHLKSILAGQHLAIAALRAAVPRTALTDPATIDRTLDNTRKALLLARDLGVSTVALHVGTLGEGGGGKVPEATLISALRELAQQADAAGLTLALSADDLLPLRGLLKQVDFDRARLNLDTARLISCGEDPLDCAEGLMGAIGQFTVADAIRAGRAARAVPLGQGQVPLEPLLRLLRRDFNGPMVVDPRDLADPAAGAQQAATVLRKLLLPTGRP